MLRHPVLKYNPLGIFKIGGIFMAQVRRLFTEKKEEFNIQASQLARQLRQTLGIKSLTGLRLFNRYDVEGLNEGEFNRAAHLVFAEANVDNLYSELPVPADKNVFAVEYLPGQYDQRAHMASQCIALMSVGEEPKVLNARVYALEGELTDEEIERIKNYIINPVESRLARMGTYETLNIPVPVPEKVKRATGLITCSEEELAEFHKSFGFAMTLEDLAFVRDYFRDEEGRDPSHTELKVLDTYWSDHCRHTTFLTALDDVAFEQGGTSAVVKEAWDEYLAARKSIYGERQKNISLMDMATIGTKVLKSRGLVNDLDESEEINACSIRAGVNVDGKEEPWIIQFKNETHNHPTEIEPFDGASTCLGGAIRDPLAGRAYVYQAMRITGCGDPNTPYEDTLPGKLPQKKITVTAAEGYSSYGNQIGVASGQIVELYDPGYVAKRMELGALVGACPEENVKREVPVPGDVVILVGGRTGRDGCGGATGSSKAHDSTSFETAGAEVQKGNPLLERNILRLFRKKEASLLIKRCNDFGAGGVSVAVGELADGLDINLDAVPTKYEGLDGTELAISESQERMAVVVAAENAEKFISLANKENLEATVIARVSSNPRLVMHWQGDTVVDISREFLNTNGLTQRAKALVTAGDMADRYTAAVPKELADLSGLAALKANLGRLEVCSQKGLVTRFDTGAVAVNLPLGGKLQLTPEEAMCAKIPLVKGETDDATVMSYGFIPGLSRWSPFHGAVYAVVESLAKLAALGVDPSNARLTMQEYFERLGDEPRRWGKPVAAMLGALTAQLNFGVPSIGGKDSMSGSFNDLDVPPTLVCFAVSMAKASGIASAAFKNAGSRVVLLPLPVKAESGLPDWEAAKTLFSRVAAMAANGTITAASVVREGGAAAAVCRMAFGNGFGFKFADGLTGQNLYAPGAGSFVAELAQNADTAGLDLIDLGTVTPDGSFVLEDEKTDFDDMIKHWTNTLEPVFPAGGEDAPMPVDIPLYKERSAAAPVVLNADVRVAIPVLPGTSSEYETVQAFAKAGAEPSPWLFKNLSPLDIEQSIQAFEEEIRASQILMLPGGITGGDEPTGSAKFFVNLLKNDRIREAVEDLLQNRDGLILGIGNGFQALLKTGLLPFGAYTDFAENRSALTANTIGRHVAQMVYTRVTSVKSPWFALVNAGDVFALPVSHGEGRFTAPEDVLRGLSANGQIAAQYVDLNGSPAGALSFNPNGSVCAVEAVTSPDGRILGKMGHSERPGDGLYRNVPFEKNQKIFEAGVKYFK